MVAQLKLDGEFSDLPIYVALQTPRRGQTEGFRYIRPPDAASRLDSKSNGVKALQRISFFSRRVTPHSRGTI
jgi:hypothetical protein|uniref:Uncharacterized protein n=2 Tax=Picea TaxID=3328 RepID=A0A117NGT9_PICGL|nr:hypothetical protein ABT39_MTgene5530 [Picea glauca]QHR91598.1 hypothetical protein Q903MT_gene5633 [Picea sitchensis]